MNWMIDGLYGDLYRTAMGYRELPPPDEWEIERRGKIPAQAERLRLSARMGSWLGRLANQFRGITAIQHSLARDQVKWIPVNRPITRQH